MIKQADVQGMFYPADSHELLNMLSKFIDQAKDVDLIPRGIIAPHAGYIYSGPIAATAYKSIEKIRDKIKNVVILSPSHRTFFKGFATSSASGFATPLGVLKINEKKIAEIKKFPQVVDFDEAFEGEHALEVHLPFIQKVLGDVAIIPLIVSGISVDEGAEVIDALWDEETLIVVSSDLSHFLTYPKAVAVDAKTAKLIEELAIEKITADSACGYYPLLALLGVCRNREYKIKVVDLRNSGDTQGDKSRVVGYGAYVVYK